ncbi:deaminase [Candidatus Gracilibacteria bacterium]|nr:deaminase [Candidatus Gracilibacteria bacterium]
MLTDINFLKIAFEIGQGSKCISKKTGSIIVKDTRILSTGYTGTPAGYVNCDEYWGGKYTKAHHDWSAKYEIHAEMNALVWAARRGISIEGATVYVTLQPCFQCTKNIVAAGIKRIVYANSYAHQNQEATEKFLRDSGVELQHISLGDEYAYTKKTID